MNIEKLKRLIPVSFTYQFIDADGAEDSEVIELKLNRLSFGMAATETFQKALDVVGDDPKPLSDILANLIEEWNINYNDQEFPPTSEVIQSLPPDFVMQMGEAVFSRLFANPRKAESSQNGSAAPEKPSNVPETSSNDDTSQSQAATGV